MLVASGVAVLAGCAPASTATSEPTSQADSDSVGVSDWNRSVKQCMDDAGFPVEYTHQGGLIGAEVPADQTDLANATMQRCMDESGANDPYTDDDLSRLYDLEVRDYDCLRTAGFAPDAPPSRQRFLDAYHTQQPLYQAYATVGDAEKAAAAKACTPARWEF